MEKVAEKLTEGFDEDDVCVNLISSQLLKTREKKQTNNSIWIER